MFKMKELQENVSDFNKKQFSVTNYLTYYFPKTFSFSVNLQEIFSLDQVLNMGFQLYAWACFRLTAPPRQITGSS